MEPTATPSPTIASASGPFLAPASFEARSELYRSLLANWPASYAEFFARAKEDIEQFCRDYVRPERADAAARGLRAALGEAAENYSAVRRQCAEYEAQREQATARIVFTTNQETASEANEVWNKTDRMRKFIAPHLLSGAPNPTGALPLPCLLLQQEASAAVDKLRVHLAEDFEKHLPSLKTFDEIIHYLVLKGPIAGKDQFEFFQRFEDLVNTGVDEFAFLLEAGEKTLHEALHRAARDEREQRVHVR